MTLVVLGADGYIGWALLCRLAMTVQEPLLAVDDLSKRRRVGALGSGSTIPILGFEERLALLRRVTGRCNITGIVGGVEEVIEPLVREHRPRAVVHLAQIPSAPYSMASVASARETIVNNELGNIALLFALREHSPDTHLVKMGSMGEYDHCGVPLGEGYVHAILDGVPACRPVPFPRAADDVYHITKINDTNFIAMACRLWGLASTDVMQSIVYGTRTPLYMEDEALATRFDCDPVFGSVLNRFVAQAVSGTPLTVHGGGHQTTGLISLSDSVAALAHWIDSPAMPGQHRVINQATETRISILEIAHLVQRIGREHGFNVRIDTAADPRHEAERPSSCGPAQNVRLRDAGLPAIALEDGVRLLMRDLLAHRERLDGAAIPAQVDWVTGADPTLLSEDAAEQLLGPEAVEDGVAPSTGGV